MYEDRSLGKIKWLKGEGFRISPHFHSSEFECHCDYASCRDQVISSRLVGLLEYIRSVMDEPITVTSAYRCKKHQADIRSSGKKTAVGKSTHELGEAVDIYTDDIYLLNAETEFIQAKGLASSFVHIDLRVDKFRRWNY